MKTILKYLFWIIFLLLVWYILYLFFQNRQNQSVINSTTVSVVSQLRSVKLLETAQMTITKIVEWEKKQDDTGIEIIWKIQNVLFQDKIVLEVEWVVSAGFDMEKLETWSVRVFADNSVSITLPPAEILHVKLTENTKPYDRTLWIFTKWNVELETEIRNQALEMIKQDAIIAWILKQAEISVTKALMDLLKSMNVNVREVKIQEIID